MVSSQLTCSDPVHQCIEVHHKDKGQSCFQLHYQLQCAHDTQPSSHSATSRALSQLATLEEQEEEFNVNQTGCVTQVDLPDSSALPATANTKLQAKFTCPQTHNKQLAVTPCGMIFGCDTMFGTEGVASVAVSPIFLGNTKSY